MQIRSQKFWSKLSIKRGGIRGFARVAASLFLIIVADAHATARAYLLNGAHAPIKLSNTFIYGAHFHSSAARRARAFRRVCGEKKTVPVLNERVLPLERQFYQKIGDQTSTQRKKAARARAYNR